MLNMPIIPCILQEVNIAPDKIQQMMLKKIAVTQQYKKYPCHIAGIFLFQHTQNEGPVGKGSPSHKPTGPQKEDKNEKEPNRTYSRLHAHPFGDGHQPPHK